MPLETQCLSNCKVTSWVSISDVKLKITCLIVKGLAKSSTEVAVKEIAAGTNA